MSSSLSVNRGYRRGTVEVPSSPRISRAVFRRNESPRRSGSTMYAVTSPPIATRELMAASCTPGLGSFSTCIRGYTARSSASASSRAALRRTEESLCFISDSSFLSFLALIIWIFYHNYTSGFISCAPESTHFSGPKQDQTTAGASGPARIQRMVTVQF